MSITHRAAGGAFAVLLLAGPAALAADLPYDPFSPQPTYSQPGMAASWAGPYIGAHLGYGWADFDQRTFNTVDPIGRTVGAIPDGLERSIDGSGFLGGLQAGYLAQHGSFVAGVEADVSISGIDGERRDRFVNGGIVSETDSAGKQHWLGSVRARAGTTFDRFLVYGTGGIAFGRAEAEITRRDTIAANGQTFSARASETANQVGWTLGAGVEGMVTDKLSARLEYSYVDLSGSETYLDYSFGTARAETDTSAHLLRAGMNYRFGF